MIINIWEFTITQCEQKNVMSFQIENLSKMLLMLTWPHFVTSVSTERFKQNIFNWIWWKCKPWCDGTETPRKTLELHQFLTE